MRKFILFIIFIGGFYLGGDAQISQQLNIPVVNAQKTVLQNGFAGGINAGQFSNGDFNNDGRADIFVFDRSALTGPDAGDETTILAHVVSDVVGAEDNRNIKVGEEDDRRDVKNFVPGLTRGQVLQDGAEETGVTQGTGDPSALKRIAHGLPGN